MGGDPILPPVGSGIEPTEPSYWPPGIFVSAEDFFLKKKKPQCECSLLSAGVVDLEGPGHTTGGPQFSPWTRLR